MSLQALIFDVDGTLAETEEAHRKAFNRAFADAGLNWIWGRERYRALLAVSGGKERIRRFVAEEDPAQADRTDFDQWVAGLHRAKTAHYTNMMAAGEIELRPGVERLIREAYAEGLRLAEVDCESCKYCRQRVIRGCFSPASGAQVPESADGGLDTSRVSPASQPRFAWRKKPLV
jgi:beta-phosphoglucomutase-like phosphatase (HAD superfamily)